MKKTIISLAFIILSNTLFAQMDTSVKKITSGNQGESYMGSGPFSGKKYELKGRTLLNNPFSDSLSTSPGTIILNIIVDSLGNVVDVTGPARGSTTEDTMLLRKATTAAYNAKFNAVDLFPKQHGKMKFTYVTKINN